MAMKLEVENPIIIDSLWRNNIPMEKFEPVEEEVSCEVCKANYLKEGLGDGIVESELWEDVYVCKYKECLEKHYTGWSEPVEPKIRESLQPV